MKYHPKQLNMWDAWFLNISGTVHAYHLQAPKEDCTLPYEEARSIGHAQSEDLLHWRQCPILLPPLHDDNNPQDYSFKFTGCATEKDGRYYLFYTMRDQEACSQRIGVALSDDATHWTPYEENPVLEPDPDIFVGYGPRNCDWGIVDCRDMIVVQNPADGLYYGYFAAAAIMGRQTPIGTVGVAVSSDLLHWSRQAVAYSPRFNGVVEVPDVYQINGKWYLTMLCGANYGGRAVTNDEYVQNCTIYAVADSPLGPFAEPDNNILIGGIPNSGFTCRTMEKDGRRYLLYVDLSYGGETLSLPNEVRLDEKGNLRAYWAAITEKLRKEQLIEEKHLPEIKELPYTSFAWKTLGGSYTADEGSYIAKTTDRDWQAAGFGLGAKSIEYTVDITILDAVAAGLWVSSRDGEKAHNYLWLIEPENQRVLLTEYYQFEVKAARKYPFVHGETYRCKLMLLEGVCELYIDGQLLLQCGLETFSGNYAGVVCDRGQASFENISLFSLEE